jgi:hypothetical protein
VIDNTKTRKILISSTPDYINAKSYNNSIKILMSSDERKVTQLMLMKYLILTSKEALALEKEVMDKIKTNLVGNGEEEC